MRLYSFERASYDWVQLWMQYVFSTFRFPTVFIAASLQLWKLCWTLDLRFYFKKTVKLKYRLVSDLLFIIHTYSSQVTISSLSVLDI